MIGVRIPADPLKPRVVSKRAGLHDPLAQLGARYRDKVEVAGSSPAWITSRPISSAGERRPYKARVAGSIPASGTSWGSVHLVDGASLIRWLCRVRFSGAPLRRRSSVGQSATLPRWKSWVRLPSSACASVTKVGLEAGSYPAARRFDSCRGYFADVAQLAAHSPGTGEVLGSSPSISFGAQAPP